MPTWLRRIFLLAPPILVAALNVAHPMARSPIYSGMVHHVDWWICLHLLNLVGFPLVGLAGYLLTQGIYHPAAIVSRVAVAVFIPIYAAFDALTGIGTGTLVRLVSRLAPDQSTTFEPILTAYWTSGTITAIAVIGSIAWTIAMLSEAVALTSPARRRPAALLSVIIFFVTGWARTNLMSPDGSTISQAWWFVLVAIGLATLIVAKPRLPALLLVFSGVLFGAAHTMPAGPLGLACLFGAALYVEFGPKNQANAQMCNAALKAFGAAG